MGLYPLRITLVAGQSAMFGVATLLAPRVLRFGSNTKGGYYNNYHG